MSWIFFAILAGLFIVFSVLWSGGHGKAGRKRAETYHKRRKHIISTIDQLHMRLMKLAQAVPDVRASSGGPVGDSANHRLAALERLVRSFEAIVSAFVGVPVFGTDPAELDSAAYLLADFSKKLSRAEMQVGIRWTTPAVRIAKLMSIVRGVSEPARQGPNLTAPGCYFCSRPFHVDLSKFSLVRVKVENKVREVFSCDVCKESLERTKKVKVLYFMQDGQPVHWAEISKGFPGEQFWHINSGSDSDTSARRGALRLVPSELPDRSE